MYYTERVLYRNLIIIYRLTSLDSSPWVARQSILFERKINILANLYMQLCLFRCKKKSWLRDEGLSHFLKTARQVCCYAMLKIAPLEEQPPSKINIQ